MVEKTCLHFYKINCCCCINILGFSLPFYNSLGERRKIYKYFLTYTLFTVLYTLPVWLIYMLFNIVSQLIKYIHKKTIIARQRKRTWREKKEFPYTSWHPIYCFIHTRGSNLHIYLYYCNITYKNVILHYYGKKYFVVESLTWTKITKSFMFLTKWVKFRKIVQFS